VLGPSFSSRFHAALFMPAEPPRWGLRGRPARPLARLADPSLTAPTAVAHRRPSSFRLFADWPGAMFFFGHALTIRGRPHTHLPWPAFRLGVGRLRSISAAPSGRPEALKPCPPPNYTPTGKLGPPRIEEVLHRAPAGAIWPATVLGAGSRMRGTRLGPRPLPKGKGGHFPPVGAKPGSIGGWEVCAKRLSARPTSPPPHPPRFIIISIDPVPVAITRSTVPILRSPSPSRPTFWAFRGLAR